MTTQNVLVACGWAWIVAGLGFVQVAWAQVPAKNETTFHIHSSYGTLESEGTVVRTESKESFEFVVEKLDFRFDPSAKTNQTKEIAMKELAIVATQKPEKGNGPYKILHRDKKAVSVRLTTDSPTGKVEKIKLVVPKDIMQKADHVGLNVTDGSILWPIRIDKSLKAQ